MSEDLKAEVVVRCGCYLIILLLNLVVGGMSVQYLIEIFTSKFIPFWGGQPLLDYLLVNFQSL